LVFRRSNSVLRIASNEPRIIVIVISLLVGIVLAYFAERRPRKRR